MRKTKSQKGITLIALIITIIVLLILAIVAIGAVQNDGIINHAKNAREEYGKAQVNENTTLQNYLTKLNENAGNLDNSTSAELIIIGKDSVELDGTITLVAQLDGKELGTEKVEWTSSNAEVATVANGVVTGVHAKKGTAIITVTSKDDSTLVAKKEITVNPKLLGDCEECTEGSISIYECSTCNKLSDSYSEEVYYYFEGQCSAMVSVGFEESERCNGPLGGYSTNPENYEGTCSKCGTSYTISKPLWDDCHKMSECGHFMQISDIEMRAQINDCSKCTDGKLYDYGD